MVAAAAAEFAIALSEAAVTAARIAEVSAKSAAVYAVAAAPVLEVADGAAPADLPEPEAALKVVHEAG